MAYSDYGGYAYRNGLRVRERSDFTIMPEDDEGGIGTPGTWPGFAMVAAGMSHETVMNLMQNNPHHHAVLGDYPFFVGLHKQAGLHVYLIETPDIAPEGKATLVKIPMLDIGIDLPPEATGTYDHAEEIKGQTYFDYYNVTKPVEQWDKPLRFKFLRYLIEAYFTCDEKDQRDQVDNFYLYVRLTQPDGTVWTGFSGYGVGEGLEQCGYGYSTEARIERLNAFFPTQEKG